ncbi:MAG: hypothetical protein II954_09425 [Synergistaceae bacterium]|nr:hypothetical protein [Synergistaceae bacterium]
MLLELMSNGTLAELPPENIPDSLNLPDESSVMLLLPHNKYLLGTGNNGGKWVYAGCRDVSPPKDVYLYDGEVLSLVNDGAQPTILPAQTVSALRRKLFMNTAPPGRHTATVLMLRTFMRDHPVFSSDYLDEKAFSREMKKDPVLFRVYWALRFALSRGEIESVRRLKAWLRVGPELFMKPENDSRIWFSLADLPDKEAMAELGELSFTEVELKRSAAQNLSPIVIYNPLSGWLVLGRMGRENSTMFIVWAYLNHELWHELRERRKMTVPEIVNAVWGEYDTLQAVNERAKYKGAD